MLFDLLPFIRAMQNIPFVGHLYTMGADGSLTYSLTSETRQVALIQPFLISVFSASRY